MSERLLPPLPSPLPLLLMSSAAVPTSVVVAGVTMYTDYVHHLSSIDSSSHPPPFPFQPLVKEKCVVGRRSDSYVYEREQEFQLQLRNGPYAHREFHVQGGDEWYYVREGEAYIRVRTHTSHTHHAHPPHLSTFIHVSRCLPLRVFVSLPVARGFFREGVASP